MEVHRLLVSQRLPVSTRCIREQLQCSRATVMRLLCELREMTRDPIPYDREKGGFHYLDPQKHKGGFPSLWFSPSELVALLIIRQQLQQMQPGFLAEALAPLDERLSDLLSYEDVPIDEIGRRVRLISLPRQASTSVTFFPPCAEAVLRRRRLWIRYHSRTRDETVEREVSPYRLSAYRDNWYLDAWCHTREALRRFAVDRVDAARVLPVEAMPYADEALDAHFSSGYGIFSGPARATAVLRFSAKRARLIADETWHRQQQGVFLPDGRYELRVPYGDPTELIMEILKHGGEAEVVAPDDLRWRVVQQLEQALEPYHSLTI